MVSGDGFIDFTESKEARSPASAPFPKFPDIEDGRGKESDGSS
jgi:hypothetical protein